MVLHHPADVGRWRNGDGDDYERINVRDNMTDLRTANTSGAYATARSLDEQRSR